MKTKKILALLLSVLIVITMIPAVPGFLVPASAGAPVDYLKPVYNKGNVVTSGIKEWKTASASSYTTLKATDILWGTGDNKTAWYVVNSNTVISGNVYGVGNINLIIQDGCVLTVNGAVTLSSATLTVYGQENSTGKFIVCNSACSDAIHMNSLTVNGCDVNVVGGSTNGSCGLGIFADSIIVNGGSVFAAGGSTGSNHAFCIYSNTMYVSDDLEVKIGNTNPPTDEVKHQISTDISLNTCSCQYISISKPVHNHEFTYTADGATLNATCTCGETQTVTVKADNKKYDGKAFETTLEGSVDGVALTEVKYYNGETELTSAPVNAGTYTAKLTRGDKTAVAEFTIAPAALSIIGTNVDTKNYDGTTDATVNEGRLSGIIKGDDVDVIATGTFEDKNVGTNKAVAVKYTLTGAQAANYTLENETVCGDIRNATMTADVTATDVTCDSFKANVILNGVNSGDFANAKIEYAISTESNPANYYWQDEATFTGLRAETDYYLFVKVTAVANYNDLTTDGEKVTTASFKTLLDEYIGQLVDELEELPEDINDIIENAINELNEFEPDNEKTLDENKEAAKDIADKAKTDLAEAIKETQENELEAYKQDAIIELDAAGEDANDILANAKTAIEAVELSAEKGLDAAKAEIDDIVAQAKADLADAGKTDDTKKSTSKGFGVGAILAVVATVVTIIITFIVTNFSKLK